jgi:hypothetical protein
MKKAFFPMLKGPSIPPSNPLKPIWPKNSNLSVFPFLKFRSKTAPVALPYSAGKAPD